MPPEEMITKAQCRSWLVEYEFDADEFPVWIHTDTGYIPIAADEEQITIPWELILEHGKKRIRFVQDWDFAPDVSPEERKRRIDEAIKQVGGSFPW